MEQKNIQNYPPDQIAKIGEDFYFTELKDKLEKEHNGEYVIIDVEKKEYVINPDKLKALEEAKKKFGEKLFSIIQIGSIQRPENNYRELLKYAWKF